MRLIATSVLTLALGLAAGALVGSADPAAARPYLASCEPARCSDVHGTVTQRRCRWRLGPVSNALINVYREPMAPTIDLSPSPDGVLASTRTDGAGRYWIDLPVGSGRVYVYAFVSFRFWPTGWMRWFWAYRTVDAGLPRPTNLEIDTTYRDCF